MNGAFSSGDPLGHGDRKGTSISIIACRYEMTVHMVHAAADVTSQSHNSFLLFKIVHSNVLLPLLPGRGHRESDEGEFDAFAGTPDRSFRIVSVRDLHSPGP